MLENDQPFQDSESFSKERRVCREGGEGCVVIEADIFHVLGHLYLAEVLSAHLLCHSRCLHYAVWTPQSSEIKRSKLPGLLPILSSLTIETQRLMQAAEGKPDEQVDQKLSVVSNR